MSKKNNRRAHTQRFNIIAKAQVQNELKQSQKRINKQIRKSVFNKFGNLYIEKGENRSSNEVTMKSSKSNMPKGYVRRRDKKILDNIRKRQRKAYKTSGMKVD